MYQFQLPAMNGGECVSAISQALREVDAQAGIEINRETKTARVDSFVPRETLAEALTQAGYPPAAAVAAKA